MEYRWIEDIGEFRAISKEWDDALLSSKSDSPFFLSDFILSWWGPYSRNLKLKIFVLTEGDAIVGGLPLCQDRLGLLECPGRIAANYTEPFCLKDGLIFWEHFFEALGELRGWRRIQVSRLRAGRFDIDGLRAVSAKKGSLLCDISEDGCSYLIDIPQDFSGYIASLPKKLRYYIKRSDEGLSGRGDVELRSYKTLDEVNALADTFIGFSRASFKGRKRISAFESEAYCLFFKELINRFCAKGYLDANALTLDGRAIAIHFGYLFGNNLNYVFPAFDIDLADLNPGHLMIYKLIELGSKRGNKFLDMYTGHQFYKEQWSQHKDSILRIEIRPNDVLCRVERRASKLLRDVKSSPVAARAMNHLRR